VSELRVEFEKALDVLCSGCGIEKPTFDAEGCTTVTVGGELLNLVYRDETDTVLVFATGEGEMPDAATCRAMLEWNADPVRSRGFTLAVDPDEGRPLVMDRREAEELADPNALAAWLEIAAEGVNWREGGTRP